MTGATFVWNGRNRREAIRFLDDHGQAWRGFAGAWPSPGEPDERTVSFRGRNGVEEAHVGQVVRVASDGGLYVTEGSDA